MTEAEEDKIVTFELEDRRLVTLNLDCEDDYGDVEIENGMRPGDEEVLIGNDEDGYVRAVRFFAARAKDEGDADEDFVDRKYRTSAEISKASLIVAVLIRLLKFSSGYTMDDLKEDLAVHGFDIDRIYIPDDWK